MNIITKEQLLALAEKLPVKPTPVRSDGGTNGRKIDNIEDWLTKNGIDYRYKGHWGGGELYELPVCPWDSSHNNGEARVIQFPSGALNAGCFHNSCQGKGWRELYAQYERRFSNSDAVPTQARTALRANCVDSVGSVDSLFKINKEGEGTTCSLLLECAADAEFFKTPEGSCYATLDVNGHPETIEVESSKFSKWLRQRFFLAFNKSPSKSALEEAIADLSARAEFGRIVFPVYHRVAHHGGNVYVDLGDDTGEVVCITPSGWSIIANPPVKFRRTATMAPLPRPVPGGTINQLWQFLNTDFESFKLIVAFILASYSNGPYPMLFLNGPQGSAKSTATRLVRSLVDPSTAPLRSAPKNDQDLMIGALNNWCLAYDNLSNISEKLSDAICVISTGGAYAARALYKDKEEAVINVQNPIIVNGITDLLTRGDLAERALVAYLTPIDGTRRQDPDKLMERFTELAPGILGAIFTGICSALANYKTVNLPRMRRFAATDVWVTAAESGLGWPEGTFDNALDDNQAQSSDMALEASPIGPVIRDFFKGNRKFEDTPTKLLEFLNANTKDEVQRQRDWPKTARTLKAALQRVTKPLLDAGVEVSFKQTSGTGSRKVVVIEKLSRSISDAIDASSRGAGFSDLPFDALPTRSGAIDDVSDAPTVDEVLARFRTCAVSTLVMAPANDSDAEVEVPNERGVVAAPVPAPSKSREFDWGGGFLDRAFAMLPPEMQIPDPADEWDEDE